jgi:hypothetical protein
MPHLSEHSTFTIIIRLPDNMAKMSSTMRHRLPQLLLDRYFNEGLIMQCNEKYLRLDSSKSTNWAAIGLLMAIIISPAKAQQNTEEAIVNQYFPQSLIAESTADFNAGGPPPFQASDFVVADLDGTEVSNYLVAAYTKGFSAVVRVIKRQGTSGSVVAEPSLPLMGGVYPFVTLVDLEGNGRPAVVVTLTSAAGFDADWVFNWDGTNLNLIGPSQVGADRNAATLLGDAAFVDLNGNGILDIVNPPEPIGLSTGAFNSEPFTVFALSGGTYVPTSVAFNFFETFARAKGEPATITKSFSTANPGAAYVMTIATGDVVRTGRYHDDHWRHDGRERIEAAEIWLNGVEVVHLSDFEQIPRVLKVPVSLDSSNTISVRLFGTPGAQLTIGIGPS